ncbi:hypothetical protein [Micromonospora saelicesensis]|uniref:hypothetical protein n=1 Tax=Micromonospora saelicesensis TaxID=285676 RepID=UPI0011BD7FEF|nr:hypothetical protein [Micromonospora saelicesensis]
MQLIAQEAKALARLGDFHGARTALDRSRRLFDDLGTPERPDNHFQVDPGIWLFYTMDTCRLAEHDAFAGHYANEVLRLGTGPDGIKRSPMRTAEARLPLAASSPRADELDRALTSWTGPSSTGCSIHRHSPIPAVVAARRRRG